MKKNLQNNKYTALNQIFKFSKTVYVIAKSKNCQGIMIRRNNIIIKFIIEVIESKSI